MYKLQHCGVNPSHITETTISHHLIMSLSGGYGEISCFLFHFAHKGCRTSTDGWTIVAIDIIDSLLGVSVLPNAHFKQIQHRSV